MQYMLHSSSVYGKTEAGNTVLYYILKAIEVSEVRSLAKSPLDTWFNSINKQIVHSNIPLGNFSAVPVDGLCAAVLRSASVFDVKMS